MKGCSSCWEQLIVLLEFLVGKTGKSSPCPAPTQPLLLLQLLLPHQEIPQHPGEAKASNAAPSSPHGRRERRTRSRRAAPKPSGSAQQFHPGISSLWAQHPKKAASKPSLLPQSWAWHTQSPPRAPHLPGQVGRALREDPSPAPSGNP